MNEVFITAYSTISSLGIGSEQTIDTLQNGINTIHFPEKNEKFKKPSFPVKYDIEINNDYTLSAKFALKLLSMIEDKWINLSPIPVFMSTSTGGIKETEEVYKKLINTNKKYGLSKKFYFYDIYQSIKETYSDKINEIYTFATACSSSGHALLQAYRFIKNNIIDKAIVIGVDALSITTLFGFDALKLVSTGGTRPLSIERDGLTLGEGGGILLLESSPGPVPVAQILGSASNSDGYHITAPHPQGNMQKECILQALQQSGLKNNSIDYINAHGTGTPANDEIEINVLKSIFPHKPKISSLKGFIGHTVGSSAVIELGICFEMLKKNTIFQINNPGTPIDNEYIPEKTINANIKYFIKNSFGFGGNNVSIVIKNLF